MIRGGLARRDLLQRLDDGPAREAVGRPVTRLSFGTMPQAPEDEVAGVQRPPRRSFRSRFDARTRSVLTGAAVAAVLVNAGAVWVYWHITGSETGRANAGASIELNLRGWSDLNKALTPGGTGDLIVTVTNDNNFPIRITAVSPGTDMVVADVEHREKGCLDPGVAVAEQSVDVQWSVSRNNVAAYTVPGGLTMAASSDPACAGAVFTVPVLVTGVAGVS